MNFKTFQLIVDNRFLDEKDFVRILSFSKKYQYRSDIHSITMEVIEGRFLWMYSQFEDCILYGETMINIDNNAEYKNTRKRNEIELRKQLFAEGGISMKTRAIRILHAVQKSRDRILYFVQILVRHRR